MADRSQLADYLWQGREPERPAEPDLVGDDVGLLVLCYLQHGEPWERFDDRPGLLVHKAPMDDDRETLRPMDIPIAHAAASVVASAMRTRTTALVTCHQGLNRSGLVSALALRLRYDLTGEEAMRRVKDKRHGSIFNPGFAEHLRSLGRP